MYICSCYLYYVITLVIILYLVHWINWIELKLWFRCHRLVSSCRISGARWGCGWAPLWWRWWNSWTFSSRSVCTASLSRWWTPGTTRNWGRRRRTAAGVPRTAGWALTGTRRLRCQETCTWVPRLKTAEDTNTGRSSRTSLIDNLGYLVPLELYLCWPVWDSLFTIRYKVLSINYFCLEWLTLHINEAVNIIQV